LFADRVVDEIATRLKTEAENKARGEEPRAVRTMYSIEEIKNVFGGIEETKNVFGGGGEEPRALRTMYSIEEIKNEFAGGDLRITDMPENALSRAFGKHGVPTRRFRATGHKTTYLMFAAGDRANVRTEEWRKRRKEECEAAEATGKAEGPPTPLVPKPWIQSRPCSWKPGPLSRQ